MEKDKINLLIVEDSQEDCELILREFDKANFYYNYVKASKEDELIRALNEFAPDVIIADFSLSDFSPYELLNYVKSNRPEIPVIFISSINGVESAVEAIRAGAHYYLLKNNIFKLVPAVLREIKDAQIKIGKKLIDEHLKNLIEGLDRKVKEKSHQYEEMYKRLNEEIEERKKKEVEVQKSYEKFTKLFQVSPIAMSISRLSDNKIIDINNAYLELLEYSRYEVIGKDPTELNIWVNPQQRVDLVEKVIKQGTVLNQEVRIKTKSGKIKTILLSIEYLFADENEPWLLFMGMNIDEIKKAEAEMLKALEKEKELGLLKNRFVSMISHEIRTPLTSIMLSTDLLRRHGDIMQKEEREKYYDRIQDTVLRITKLLENVLTISRLEEGKFDFHPETIDLIDFFHSIAEGIEFNTSGKNKIKIITIGEKKEVVIDENLLGLAITNLLNNAVKYSYQGDEVIVEIEFELNRVIIKIRDKGIGIPKEELPFLFQSFFRAFNVGNISGYGIGLSIVKKCIEAHNGTIDVESDLGKGTTFSITIPIKQEINELS